MIIKVAIPNQIQLKVVPRFKSMFLAQKGEIHYIGGSEILPPPLNPVEESEAIHNLLTVERTSNLLPMRPAALKMRS